MVKLEQGERELLEVRKHWFAFVSRIFILPIFAVVPFIIYFIISSFAPIQISWNGSLNILLVGAFFVWLLALWITFFVIWTDYYLDVLIVSDQRIINVNQKGLFDRDVATCRMENVQDITTETAGLIPTLLKFGDVRIQTAGEKEEFVIKNAANPEEAKRVISDQHDIVYARFHGMSRSGV